MTQSPIPTLLNEEEWRVILALRDIPNSPLRSKILEILEDLLRFVRQPRCLGLQSDGFPCGSPDTSCEDCQKMLDALEGLRPRLES